MASSDRPDRLTRVARAGLLLVALSSALYLLALDRYPVVIGGDEVHFAVHAESIARSGRDLNGTAFPAFVRIIDPIVPNPSSSIWYQPVLFYAMAPFVGLLGIDERAARLPVALVAIVNIWLVYAIGRRLFRSREAAIAGALLLAMTPAHVIVARQALDYLAPLPFVLGWFLCLLRFLDTGSVRSVAAGSLLLGAGVFTYIAAWLLMPFLFALTAIVIWRSDATVRARAMIAASIVFAIPVLLLAAALATNPDMLANTLTRYSVYSAAQAPPRPGLFERVTLYWDYFNPSFLFFAGGANPTQATGRVGVFLLALAPLLLAGLREIWRQRDTRSLVVLAVFAASPFPIAVTMPPAASYSIARVMTLLPFGILIAVWGLQSLWRTPWRPLVLVLLLAIPVQFALFSRDYVGDYQRRAAPRLDPAHIRAVADTVLAQDRSAAVPAVYLSHHLDDGGARWRFFMLKNRRTDLLERTRQLNLSNALPSIEPGALIVSYAGDGDARKLIGLGYRLVADIKDAAGTSAALVLKAPG